MTEFYGFFIKVVELTFLHGHRTMLFQCEWYKTMHNDKHFICVDTRSRWQRKGVVEQVLPSE